MEEIGHMKVTVMITRLPLESHVEEQNQIV